MTTPPRSGASAPSPWNDSSDRRPQRAKPLTRQVEVAYLASSGEVCSFNRLAPALPMFDEAFSAVARGALIATPDGPIAVEDLVPGTRIITDIGSQALLWVGRMTAYPNNPALKSPELIRITADTLGYGRPMQDLMLAGHARLVHRASRCQEIVGQDSALAPARAYIDGLGVFAVTPPTAVPLYQLGFATHRSYSANGIELESVHPGQTAQDMTEASLMALYLGFFPQLRQVSDFGPLVMPRLSSFEVANLLAA